MPQIRGVTKTFLANEQAEGDGARVRRSVGTAALRNFSPFLMLDHFRIPRGAGFPDHPHRGQETITYLLKGAVDHEDFAGNAGTIRAGDLQFMTAGRGIMHAEMPNPEFKEHEGMQLWVDLPKALKNCEPRYRDLRGSEIPKAELDDGKVEVKVISGQCAGIDSVKELAYTPVWILDISMKPGGKLLQELPAAWNAFAYLISGEATFGESGKQVHAKQFHNVVFESQGDAIAVEVDEASEKSARIILIAGQPLDQQVVQYGPFVVTSKQEIYQAMSDFSNHENGFERARGWRSEIGKLGVH